MAVRLCRFDPGSGYRDKTAWIWLSNLCCFIFCYSVIIVRILSANCKGHVFCVSFFFIAHSTPTVGSMECVCEYVWHNLVRQTFALFLFPDCRSLSTICDIPATHRVIVISAHRKWDYANTRQGKWLNIIMLSARTSGVKIFVLYTTDCQFITQRVLRWNKCINHCVLDIYVIILQKINLKQK